VNKSNKKRTHHEFLDELRIKNKYAYDNLVFVEEYINCKQKITARSRYGLVWVYPGHLLKGAVWTNNSALDKTSYFIEKLKYVNPRISESIIRFNSEYISGYKNIRFETKYGECAISPNRLLNLKDEIGIKSAVDKTDYFMRELRDINKSCFDRILYLTSEYEGALKKIKFMTNHGECAMSPDSMKSKKAMPTFESALNKTQYLISEAREIHGDLYDYSMFEYTGSSHTLYPIICKEHEVFHQDFASHKQGFGCKKCSDAKKDGFYSVYRANKNEKEYKAMKSGVYILEMADENEKFYKIGLSKNVNKRRSQIEKRSNYSVTLLWSLDCNLYDAIMIENKLHDINKEFKYNPNTYFEGYTESFLKLSKETILKMRGGILDEHNVWWSI